MDVGFILITGLVTSVHCVAMCGTMVATYAIRRSAESDRSFEAGPHLAYHAARLVSYTVVGLALGAVGSALELASVRGAASLAAGGFMVLLGLNMLDIHPMFRVFSLRLPRGIARRMFGRAGDDADRYGAPLLFGLLTGVMPCGPLQAMQLYAAGTGSALLGAATMALFGAMTVPMMLVVGATTQFLGHAFRRRVMAVGAVVVVVFGVVMLDRGLTLAGSPVTLKTIQAPVATALGIQTGSTGSGVAAQRDGVQEVTIAIERTRYVPDTVSVRAGVPVRLTVDRREDGVCSDELVIPSAGVRRRLPPFSKTVVEFTPSAPGRLPFTCGMGMMSGTFLVGDPDTAVAAAPDGGVGVGGAAGAVTPTQQEVAANRMFVGLMVMVAGAFAYRVVRLRTALGGSDGRPAQGGLASGSRDPSKREQKSTGRAKKAGGKAGDRAAKGPIAGPPRRELAWAAAAIALAILAGYVAGTLRGRGIGGGAYGRSGRAGAVEQRSGGLEGGAFTTGASGGSPGVARVSPDGGSQTFTLRVAGGYSPPVIQARRGIPLTLTVERRERSFCTKYLVFPTLGIQQVLPDDGKLALRLPGLSPGRYRFQCGMDMLSGELVIR